jgi:hypothetical protein
MATALKAAVAVTSNISGRTISDVELMAWEVERARVAKALLIERLGPDAVIGLLQRDLDESAARAKQWVEASGGRYAASVTEIESGAGTAPEFLRWIHDRFHAQDYAVLNGASPEHYALRGAENGWMDVTETIGGYGLPIRFYVVVTGSLDDAPAPVDPTLTHRLIGRIRGMDGTEYGRVMHQFGDTPSGFRARLGVWWPAAAPRELVDGHCWHLAGEFSLWIRAYLASGGHR